MPDRVVAVYILTNWKNSVIYTGVTSDLEKRLGEHGQNVNRDSFAARYNLSKLVYFETTPDILAAIAREKQIKGGSRAKKIALIETMNPQWKDLRVGV